MCPIVAHAQYKQNLWKHSSIALLVVRELHRLPFDGCLQFADLVANGWVHQNIVLEDVEWSEELDKWED